MKKAPSIQQPASVETAETKTNKFTFKNVLNICALSLALMLTQNAKAQEQTLPEMERNSIESITSVPTQVLNKSWQKEKSNLEVHGSVWAWSNVTPLLWSVLGDKPALRLTIDVSDPKTWIWASLIRFDDFNKSMDNPASQLTMIDIYKTIKWKNFSITWVWEYVNIDKIPGADSFTPIVWCTYDAWKWWTLDTWACHTFQKWKDVDDFRIWATKALNQTLSLATQAFYKYDWNHKFSWRFQAIFNLRKGVWFQMEFTAKDGKIIPTGWLIFKH